MKNSLQETVQTEENEECSSQNTMHQIGYIALPGLQYFTDSIGDCKL